MKNCPRCNAQMEDNAVFCQNCGFSVAQQAEPQAQQPQYNQYAAAPAPVINMTIQLNFLPKMFLKTSFWQQ